MHAAWRPSGRPRRALLLAAAALAFAGIAFGALRLASGATGDALRIRVRGPEEVVFDWSRQRCDDTNVPDLPVRAFRDERGRVQLVLAHYVNRRLVGPSVARLRVDCRVVLGSPGDRDPTAFADRRWLAAVYTRDGRNVYALVHEEYQGNRHRGRCPSGVYVRCWYNAVELAVSRDGGDSYVVRSPPAGLVATIPFRYVPDDGPVGVFEPSNIVRNPHDGLYYALVRVRTPGARHSGACLIRTRDLNDARSWRAWSGTGFSGRFRDPYEGDAQPARPCRPVAPAEIADMTQSLTYNTYAGRFLLVGSASAWDARARRVVWGVYYAFSEDLVRWTPRRLLMRAELPWSYRCGGPDPILYPAALDPSSPSRSFDTSGRTPYLYFTRLHYRKCVQTADRDLVRTPLELSRAQDG